MKLRNIFMWFFVIVFIITITFYLNLRLKANPSYPIVFSEQTMISELWKAYKREYIEEGTFRTIDKQRANITTSEGQSYSMLRAVWIGDKETFDNVWKWTQDNLQRKGTDNLFAWLYGANENGEYGVRIEEGGFNTASDADQDIALALIFAFNRWNDSSYLTNAQAILKDIWEKEVVLIKGKYYLASNDIERFKDTDIIVNPSYFAPYAYKIFSKIDSDRPWLDLVDSSYEVLEKVSNSNLDKLSTSYLPPDWAFINKQTGELDIKYTSGLTSNFSFDAIRTIWRLSLDFYWFNDSRAEEQLKKYKYLLTEWQANKSIYLSYSHDGDSLSKAQSHSVYGATIGYFMITNPDIAQEIYNLKLKPLYSPDNQGWLVPLGYYDDNWTWFGISLYLNKLPNLTENL